MAKKFKNITHTGTVLGAVEGATSDIVELHQEMDDWASNMEGNSMEHLPKYDEVSEARDALERAKDPLESIDIPEEVGNLEISYIEHRPYGRKSMSRSMRLSNAQNQLDAAKDRVSEYQSELRDRDEVECDCPDGEHVDDCPNNPDGEDGRLNPEDDFDFLQELEEARDATDEVSFPGMFG